MKTLQDRFWLIVTGFIAAGCAAVFWRVTGAHGFEILGSVTVVGLSAEIRRLRKRIVQLESGDGRGKGSLPLA
jgi:hypothetical protein